MSLIIEKLEENLITVFEYVECECSENYIHKFEENFICPCCALHVDDMPNARLEDVHNFFPDTCYEILIDAYGNVVK